jgi:hypothetical protein
MIRVCLMMLMSVAAVVCGPCVAATDIDLGALCLELAPIQEPGVDTAAMKTALGHLIDQARAAIAGSTAPADIIDHLNTCLLSSRDVTYLSNIYSRDSTLAAALLRGHANCIATTNPVCGRRPGVETPHPWRARP